jgi:hypothetical protein
MPRKGRNNSLGFKRKHQRTATFQHATPIDQLNSTSNNQPNNARISRLGLLEDSRRRHVGEEGASCLDLDFIEIEMADSECDSVESQGDCEMECDCELEDDVEEILQQDDDIDLEFELELDSEDERVELAASRMQRMTSNISY